MNMGDQNIVSKKAGLGEHSLVQSSPTSSPKAMGLNIKTTPANSSELPLPAIIGGAVGGVVLIVLVVGLVIYIWYRRKYPVRMVLGKDFQKFSNPAYNTKRMSSLQLTAEDPLASYDEPMEQINEGFMIEREDRDSIFDDMSEGPRYLSQEQNSEINESGDTSKQSDNSLASRQDSEVSIVSTESGRKIKKAILVTSEESGNFVISNELDSKSEVDGIMKQEHDNRTFYQSGDNSGSNSSYSCTNETESKVEKPISDRIENAFTPGVISNEDGILNDDHSFVVLRESVLVETEEPVVLDIPIGDPKDKDKQVETTITNEIMESETQIDNISVAASHENIQVDSEGRVINGNSICVPKEIWDYTEIGNINESSLQENSETFIKRNVLNDSEENDSNDKNITKANDVNDEDSNGLNTISFSHDNGQSIESLDETLDAGKLSSNKDFDFIIGSQQNPHISPSSDDNLFLKNHVDSVQEVEKNMSFECDELEMTIPISTASLDRIGDFDNDTGDEVRVYSPKNDSSGTLVSNNITELNETDSSPLTNSIVDSADKDIDELPTISTGQKEDVTKEVDLEVLKLGYDLIKQSVRSPSEEKISPILSPENLVLERPPPTPTVVFDSIILEPDISSFENKFHSVPDVRIHTLFTIDAEIQPERRRARTSLDNSITTTLSDSFESLISSTNQRQKPEATSLPDIAQSSSSLGEMFHSLSTEGFTEDESKLDNFESLISSTSHGQKPEATSLPDFAQSDISFDEQVEQPLTDRFTEDDGKLDIFESLISSTSQEQEHEATSLPDITQSSSTEGELFEPPSTERFTTDDSKFDNVESLISSTNQGRELEATLLPDITQSSSTFGEIFEPPSTERFSEDDSKLDKFQSLISSENQGQKSEATFFPNIVQSSSTFGELLETSSPVRFIQDDRKNDDDESNKGTIDLLGLDNNTKSTSSNFHEYRTDSDLNDTFHANPFEGNNFDDTDFNMVRIDSSQFDKDVNNISEKDFQSDLTTSSESSSSKSWELIEESSASLIDFNCKTESETVGKTGAKLLKIEPSSFDFGNDSSEESKDSDEDSLEVITEGESNA